MKEYSDEEVIKAIDSAPEAVRDMVTDRKTAQIIADIGGKYKLHIDAIGKLAQINRNMLIGISSPAEALGNLVFMDVQADVAKSILGELNERIFIPLREQIKSGGTPAEERTVAPAKALDAAPPETVRPEPRTAAPDIRTPLMSAPSIGVLSALPSPSPEETAAVTPEVGRVPELQARTMATDVEMLTSVKPVAAPVSEILPAMVHSPSPRMPARSFQTASVPSTIQEPTPIPSRILPSIEAYPAQNETRTDSHAVKIPLAKEYGEDPYREPI